ncbi:hypothetical protein FHR48_000374 [Xanthomonas arboricola]|nr:hypothetical protein [Xanthomonas cannabis]NIK62878.1 hypothetical protein [Xanthomonas cannabis]
MSWKSIRWCCTCARSARAEPGVSQGRMTRRLRPPCALWGVLVDLMDGLAPIRPSGTFPRRRGKGAVGGQSKCNRHRAQPGIPSPAGGRRWRAAPDEGRHRVRLSRLSWSRRRDVAPIRPSGTFPPRAREGRGGGAVAAQPADHAQPGIPSPADGRRWRAAPDEGRHRVRLSRLSWSCCSDVAPIRPSGTFPRRRGKGAGVVSCSATGRSRAARHPFSRWREKVARGAG